MDIDDAGGNSLCRQRVGGGQCHGYQDAVCHDGDIGAVPQNLALADLKAVGVGIVENRHCVASEAQVAGSRHFQCRLQRGDRLHRIGGADDGHAGQDAHQRDILQALVGCAVLADRDAGVGGGDLDVQVRVCHAVADLLEGASGGEHGEGGREHGLAGGGKSGGDADHVALGDAAVKEAVGESLCKVAGLGRLRKVGVQHREIVIGTQLAQSAPVCLSCGDLVAFFQSVDVPHAFYPPYSCAICALISPTACPYCSSFGAEPCHLT